MLSSISIDIDIGIFESFKAKDLQPGPTSLVLFSFSNGLAENIPEMRTLKLSWVGCLLSWYWHWMDYKNLLRHAEEGRVPRTIANCTSISPSGAGCPVQRAHPRFGDGINNTAAKLLLWSVQPPAKELATRVSGCGCPCRRPPVYLPFFLFHDLYCYSLFLSFL